MSLWEYKVITSGKGGFATPALLEKFLNDLGRDEWEIIHFQTPPDNFLAFTGLVRRSTQRDWTLQDAAAAAAKLEAEKLRAEFEAKFKAAASPGPAAAEERAPSFLEEKSAPDDGFRKPVDTSHDDDPEAQEDEKADEWDKLTAAEEDELPTFFEAIKPHMRRNQRGPGMSVGVDYLAKKWDQTEDDLKGALVECGLVMPVDEDSKAEYVEYDGDLYWLNINRRGELWINTKEKPRPVFRSVKAQRIVVEDEAAKQAAQQPKRESRDENAAERGAPVVEGAASAEVTEAIPATGSGEQSESAPAKPRGNAVELPSGTTLLDKIRPHMRRNRRGPGGSGSATFLARALRSNETDLRAAFVQLGLTMPATPAEKVVYTEFGNELWWLNVDSRGGLWINGRERKQGETAAAAGASDAATAAEAQQTSGEQPAAVSGEPSAGSAATEQQPASGESPPPSSEQPMPLETVPASAATDAVPAPEGAPSASPSAEPAPVANQSAGQAPATLSPSMVLAAVRLLLKETKTGSIAAKTDRVAEELGKPVDDFVATLVGAGLKVPEKAREKPVFVEHAGEIFWLNRNAKGELWLNAKASKFGDKDEAGPDDAEADSATSEEADGDNKPARRGGRSKTKKPE